ncbi:diguanylate cyclase [Pseudoxanthomonas sp. SL93]|uniref:diguanylate cyclase domain-containing protein n=1 Tax=Pseudoxanthomonas sp. SL93 TaxID=2995142 RepID=UPI002271BAEE|nr:diguanylate cyclase [Pseudoxanthomonas sp. SL93]WAC64458.1 diguanylate cyclase [Pseudoxanthomonas sp. SL93]
MVAILVAAGAWLSISWAGRPGELSAMWISGGILCAWLLVRPTATWGVYCAVGAAADVAGQWVAGTPLPLATALSVCHLIEVLVVAYSIRREVPNIRDPRRWIHLGGVATASTLVACGVSGLLAAQVARYVLDAAFGMAFATWYGAHVLGMVIVGTAALVLHVEGLRALAPQGRRTRFILGMGLIAMLGLAVFSMQYPLLFLTYPPLLLGAFRHRFAGVAVGVTLLAVIGVAFTTAGRGPLAEIAASHYAWAIVLLQLYLAGGCLLTIPVVLAMAERDRLSARVRDSEQRYRLLADFSGDLVVRLNPSGERTYVSPSAREMLGWSPDEMLGSRWDLMHPDDREGQRQAMLEVVASGLPQTHRFRIRHRDGKYLWVEVVMRSAPGADPSVPADLILSGRNISKRVAAEQALEASRLELERLSLVDALTGVANRRQLERRLALALARLKRGSGAIALFFLDLDHFKDVNDTHGHATGDGVIRCFAQRLQQLAEDGKGLVVRLGGDEFVILLDGDLSVPSIEQLAQRILAATHAPMNIGASTLLLTTSIGIAFALSPVDEDDLLATADEALYRAKQQGRNRFHLAVAQAAAAPRPSRDLPA